MVVVRVAVPTLILVLLGVYLWVGYARKELERRVFEIKAEADDLARTGQPFLAYKKYEEMLALGREKDLVDSSAYRLVFAEAKESQARLYTLVMMDVARDESFRQSRAFKTGPSSWSIPSLPSDSLVILVLLAKPIGAMSWVLARSMMDSKRRYRRR